MDKKKRSRCDSEVRLVRSDVKQLQTFIRQEDGGEGSAQEEERRVGSRSFLGGGWKKRKSSRVEYGLGRSLFARDLNSTREV